MNDETPASSSDAKFESLIRDALPGVEITCFSSIDSTNDQALRGTRDGTVKPPALFAAREQTAGRGRRGRRWSSGPGAATFSLVVTDPLDGLDSRRGWIPLLMADAVCEALSVTTGVAASIKWPNDVMLDNRKLAGLLVEAVPSGGLVIGCGINVRNPAPLAISISLRDVVAQPPHPADVIAAVARQMLQHLARLPERFGTVSGGKESRSPITVEVINGKRDWLRDRRIEITSSAGTVTGRAVGFAGSGALRIQDETNNTVTEVVSGTVSVLADVNAADRSRKTD